MKLVDIVDTQEKMKKSFFFANKDHARSKDCPQRMLVNRQKKSIVTKLKVKRDP